MSNFAAGLREIRSKTAVNLSSSWRKFRYLFHTDAIQISREGLILISCGKPEECVVRFLSKSYGGYVSRALEYYYVVEWLDEYAFATLAGASYAIPIRVSRLLVFIRLHS